jgi:low temperature requirement protein LtrA
MTTSDQVLAAPEQVDAVTSVSTLELFFDLVFVFTITQLTSALASNLSWRGLLHVVVMLGLIFWMYDGYAWLTNAVPTRGARRQALLFGAMASYLMLAIAIPSAFAGSGLTFGIAYLAINAIHAFLYVSQAGDNSAAAMRALAPWNLASAIAVVVAGAFGGTVQLVVWGAVVALLWFGTRTGEGFEIGPAHFVERHSLLVLIAIGESVVATGIGARTERIDLGLAAVTVLGLMLSAGLWVTYFGDDSDQLEEAFRRLQGGTRVRAAFVGFGYAHWLMLLGIVFASVGVRQVVEHPWTALDVSRAFLLSGGVALFLLADGWFRATLRLRRARPRLLGAPLLLLAVPLGTATVAAAGLAGTIALLACVLVGERRLADHGSG